MAKKCKPGTGEAKQAATMPPVSYSLMLFLSRHRSREKETGDMQDCNVTEHAEQIQRILFLSVSLPHCFYISHFRVSSTSIFSLPLWRSFNGRFTLVHPVALTRLISFESRRFTGVPLGFPVLAVVVSLKAVWCKVCSLTLLSACDTQSVTINMPHLSLKEPHFEILKRIAYTITFLCSLP